MTNEFNIEPKLIKSIHKDNTQGIMSKFKWIIGTWKFKYYVINISIYVFIALICYIIYNCQ